MRVDSRPIRFIIRFSSGGCVLNRPAMRWPRVLGSAIIKALKASFETAHKYIDSITDANDFVMTKNGTRGGQAAYGIAHMEDHYGQLCVYLRMNGIVPPASQKK